MRPPTAVSHRSGRLPGLVVLLALLATAATLILVGALGGRTPSTRAEQVQQIASGLRCPVCQDLSAAASPEPLAGQMRRQISEQLAAGRSADQIRQGFIAAYGESVLMSPPHSGLGQTAYVLPVLVMGMGAVVVTVLLRHWRSAPDPLHGAQTEGGPADLAPSDRRAVTRALMLLQEEEGR